MDSDPDQQCFDFYADGEYSKASDCLNGKIISDNISDTLRLLKIYEKLGAAFVMQDRKDLAKAAFKKLLSLNRDVEIDPNKYLPEIISLFLITKFEYRTSLRVVILDTVPAYPVKWNYFAFGIPQFKNGDKKKGLSIIGLQILSLSLSILAYNKERSYMEYAYGVREENLSTAGNWDRIHRFSFVSFTAVTLYSLVDGFLKKPVVVKQ
jgi:tetratricopeptide (TPR) repeat protein